MKRLWFVVVALLYVPAFSQSNEAITIGKVDSLHSSILGEERKIMIYVPDAQNSIYSEVKYPVVYLLDGEGHFNSVVGLIEQLSTVNGNTLLPKMIVVGIPNTDRSRDLTPTHSLLMTDGTKQDFLSTTGGGEKFTDFIEKELIPYVDSHYPTTSYRVLIGHSFGGLFALNALFHHTGLFGAYLAIDPSLWWDHQHLLNEMMSGWSSENFDNKRLYLGVANTMPHGMLYTSVGKDTTSNTVHMRNILQFAHFVDTHPGKLNFHWKYYPDDDHGSVPLIAEYDGLRQIFDFYKLPSNNPDEFTPEDIVAHYKKASSIFGYTLAPPEQLVNEAGYHWLQRNKYDDAYVYFKMNTDNYPNSFNVWDSMGDYYAQNKDNQKAVEMYTKALTIKDVPETREKMEKLKGK